MILAFAGSVWARGSGVELGVFGSYVSTNDLGDGTGAGLKLELQPSDWFSIDARASAIRFGNKNVDMIPLELAALLNIPLADEQIVPYVGVGCGYYFFEADKFSMDDHAGFFPLLGLEIGAYNLSFLAEARWLSLGSSSGEPDVDGLGINLGLLFRF